VLVDKRYFEEAAAVLERAIKATGLAEQAQLLDEALRLNRLGLAAARTKLEKLNPPSAAPGAEEKC
jgi:hypothetical protein